MNNNNMNNNNSKINTINNTSSSNGFLGEYNVKKLLFRLALPAVISQLINVLYNIVDRIYIGRIPIDGVDALTGLGLCFPIIMLVTAFASLYGMGGAPKAAIALGQKNIKKAELTLGNCITALVFTSIILTTVLLIWGKDLLFLFGASNNTISYAWDYLSIYALSTIFILLTLGLNMFITTQGYAKTSMCTVIIGAVINIILDPIFIYLLDMGVQGAALATLLAQMVSATWVICFLMSKKSIIKIKKNNLIIKKAILLPIIALGASPFVMQSTESLLNICFNVSLYKYGGDLAVGSMTILSSILTLCILPLQGICQGGQPIISYNYGAKKYKRVKEAIKLQVMVCSIFTTLYWIFLMIFPNIFVGIFSSNPALLEISSWAIRIYAFGVFAMGIQISCQQAFISLDQAKVSILLACLRKIILLIPLIFILPNFFSDKLFAVLLAEPIADIGAATITFITFTVITKKILSKNKSE